LLNGKSGRLGSAQLASVAKQVKAVRQVDKLYTVAEMALSVQTRHEHCGYQAADRRDHGLTHSGFNLYSASGPLKVAGRSTRLPPD
jgi:delta-aminolevulinic acid dehydratase/porphobilinogen synthase